MTLARCHVTLVSYDTPGGRPGTPPPVMRSYFLANNKTPIQSRLLIVPRYTLYRTRIAELVVRSVEN